VLSPEDLGLSLSADARRVEVLKVEEPRTESTGSWWPT